MPRPEQEGYTPFSTLTDAELKEAMLKHIKMGYILKFPGKSKEAEQVAQEIINRLTIEQMKEINPHTFFFNKPGSEKPKNPYDLAIELLGE
ncbi:hypothetical protein [Methanospirillum sp.]